MEEIFEVCDKIPPPPPNEGYDVPEEGYDAPEAGYDAPEDVRGNKIYHNMKLILNSMNYIKL